MAIGRRRTLNADVKTSQKMRTRFEFVGLRGCHNRRHTFFYRHFSHIHLINFSLFASVMLMHDVSMSGVVEINYANF